MARPSSSSVWSSLLGLLALSAPLAAQTASADTAGASRFTQLITPGSPAEDRLRLEQLLGRGPLDAFLLRSSSALAGADTAEAGWSLLGPELTAVYHERIPLPLHNQGLLWAGRGWGTKLSAGVRAAWGPVRLQLAPEITRHQNGDFQVLPVRAGARDTLSSPWYRGSTSIDLPQRQGEGAFTRHGWGQSMLALEHRGWQGGLSTESRWWGPGIRNALVLSDNAPGFPHLFVRTARPLAGRMGRLEVTWLLGGLAESAHFDSLSANDRRSFNALGVAYAPAFEPNLTVGLARAVYAPVEGWGGVAGHALDVVRRYNRRVPHPDRPGHAWDQITSLFGRWVLPRSGMEVYAEWSRLELPASARDFLLEPNHTQGYTLGLQWARALGDGGLVLRLQPELTNLEQSTSFKQRPTSTYYVSRAVPQGYTHRGQVLGAAIGPGSSSQWLAADLLHPVARLGLFAGRVRWNNDAYYATEPNLSYAHDVSMLGGVRAGLGRAGVDWSLEYGVERRYNYLFQNRSPGFEGELAVDVVNHFFRMSLRPFARR